jgi:hypothetical protein
MIFLNLTCLAFSTVIGVMPISAAHTDTDLHTLADSEQVLTVDILAHMTTFWATLMKEPDSIKVAGRKANQNSLRLLNGKMTLPGVVNMVGMASRYPAVATDLKQAGLTALQWEQYRKVLLEADLIKQITDTIAFEMKKGSAQVVQAISDFTPTQKRNAKFWIDHEPAADTLKATGMYFAKWPVQFLAGLAAQAKQQSMAGMGSGYPDDVSP